MDDQHNSGAHPVELQRGVRLHQLLHPLFLGRRYVNGSARLWTSHT